MTSAATKSMTKTRQLFMTFLCKVTQSPVTTGSSVLAMKYEVIQLSLKLISLHQPLLVVPNILIFSTQGGVLMAADTLGSYGSMAR